MRRPNASGLTDSGGRGEVIRCVRWEMKYALSSVGKGGVSLS